MIDPRFYELHGPISAGELAAAAGLAVTRGDERRTVNAMAASAQAGPDDLTFIDSGDAASVARIEAGVCITTPALAAHLPASAVIIEAPAPRYAYARIAARIATLREIGSGGEFISPKARISDAASIGPGAVIGAGVVLGRGATIGPCAVIYPGVQIGAGSSVGAHAVIRCALIGDGVSILSGAAIGEAGFGLAAGPGGAIPTPHYGRVIIQDRASIGANSCVDRGLFDDTIIGEGAHIDNLCHVGHNVRVGRGVVMAAFAGVSGSAVIGDGVMFGGRVGVADHITVGEGARIGAGSAVLRDVPAGETHGGYPAKSLRTWMRELLWLEHESQKRPDKTK